MPHHEGELNMRLFANRVLPVLHADTEFTAQPRSEEPASKRYGQDVFVPA